MTKMTRRLHRLANFNKLVMIPLSEKIDESIRFVILNFSHWRLFEIWFLVLGIFVIFAYQIILLAPSGAHISIHC